ncbi:hypothetical protein J1N09_06810 [Aureitalea sp. L0-47]|uniref:hypothetical protein n=1 Tax=Aureitalea sp. L0-47 TaxID=2816962 RepID=UPI0022370AD2|nr:hypothetical protein [Aureitalea sp. L0-47]MCW5519542.1 hypothetical protein [Aureitalea sp. L0-47]
MKKLLLINAIVWAALILVAAFLFKDVPNYNYFFIGMVFAAGLMNSLIYTYSRPKRKSKCSY